MSSYKKERFQNAVFVIKRKLIEIFVAIFVGAIVIISLNQVFNYQLFSSLLNKNVQITLSIFGVYILYHEIMTGKDLNRFLNYMDTLRELESRGNEESYSDCKYIILGIKSSLDTLKVKIDILKSLSPISLVVLLMGFLINREKNVLLEWNIYTVVLIILSILYAQQLYQSFQYYRTAKSRLLDAMKARDKIEKELKNAATS